MRDNMYFNPNLSAFNYLLRKKDETIMTGI